MTLADFKWARRADTYLGRAWWKSREGEGGFAVSLEKPTQATQAPKLDEDKTKEEPRMKQHVVRRRTVFYEQRSEL